MARLGSVPILSPIEDKKTLRAAHVWSRWFRDIAQVVESVSNRGVSVVSGGETLNLSESGVAINLTADTGNATVVLPYATVNNIGEEVIVTLINDTHSGFINPKSGDTLIGETSVEMNLLYTSYTCMVLSANTWVII